MDQELIEQEAEALRKAGETRTPVPPLHERLPATDVALGYAIQDANTDYWLKNGRKLVGRKIGLTSRAVQAQLGVDQPDYGMLFADMCFADGEEIPAGRLIQPKVEGEIAFVLERDLDREGMTIADVARAVAFALPAIEIVDSRVADWKIRILDTVADNASSALYVLGTVPVKLDGLDLFACGMVLEHRGEPVSVGAGAACMGNPLTSTLWLARKMVEVGRPLKAGDTIMSGALGPMVVAAPGGAYELRISGLGSVRTMFERGEAA